MQSAIWDQYLVLYPEFPQGSPQSVAAVWWLLYGRYSFLPEFPQGSPAHHPWWLQSLMTVASFVYCYNTKYSISHFTLFMTDSRSIHVSTDDPILFLFYDWVIFHCIYVPHLLYPFLCWWTFRLLPCPCIYRTLCPVKSVAMNINVHMSFWIMVFSGYMSSSRTAGSLLLFSHSALSDSLWPHGL